jgi:hypothetical protein
MRSICIQCGEERDYINCKEIDCPQAFWNNNGKGHKNMAINNTLSGFDFGFSAVTEHELKQQEKQQIDNLSKQAEALATTSFTAQEKLDSLYKMIIPLIDNLSKDPEKEYILWPGRDKKLAEFKAKIIALVND